MPDAWSESSLENESWSAHQARYDAATTVLIGDTTRDVQAGHDGGARVIAVASGTHTTTDLHDAGADTVLPDLTDTEALVTTIVGHEPTLEQ